MYDYKRFRSFPQSFTVAHTAILDIEAVAPRQLQRIARQVAIEAAASSFGGPVTGAAAAAQRLALWAQFSRDGACCCYAACAGPLKI